MRPLAIIVICIIGLFLFKTYYLDASNNEDSSTTQGQNKEGSSNSSSQKSLGIPVDVYVAKLVNKSNVVYATGTVVPNEEVELRSEVSGRLVQLNIREGSYVQKGKLIAKLNDADLLAQVKKLDFEEQLAGQTEARYKKLIDIDAISKEEYDLAVNRINTLSADKELLKVQLEKTRVVAPFSGRIGFKYISEGAYITPNTVIANLVQSNPVKLDFTVPEKYVSKIKVGNEILFTTEGDDIKTSAKIIAIDPKIDEELRTLKVRASANNKGGKYLPGMFIRVEAPLGDEESIMIPTESIIPILKGKKIYVMKNGKAKEAIISTGLRTDTEVQVIEGLEVGDSVIVSALMSMKENTDVSVKNVFD